MASGSVGAPKTETNPRIETRRRIGRRILSNDGDFYWRGSTFIGGFDSFRTVSHAVARGLVDKKEEKTGADMEIFRKKKWKCRKEWEIIRSCSKVQI